MDQTIPKTMFPSSSAITYWLIEHQSGPVAGMCTIWLPFIVIELFYLNIHDMGQGKGTLKCRHPPMDAMYGNP